MSESIDPSFFSSALIESVSFQTTTSTSVFTSNGQTETTTIPITITAFESLVPYLPSETPETPEPPAPTKSRSTFPVLAITAAAGGLVAVLLATALYVYIRQRRRRPVRIGSDQKLCLNTVPLDTLDVPAHGTRTFSRLTFSAPYVLPQSPANPSTAAPSTVSMGQQYQYGTVPSVEGR
ncbi:hypothetical protein B0H11DRAFT_1902109 [Mycena galericulata]|nr:hypothetical protein B0H11DRAFT_1902109 [Mycena galericulata]